MQERAAELTDKTVLANLLGSASQSFGDDKWPNDLLRFRCDPDWFQTLTSHAVLSDSEEWLDRAPELRSFRSFEILARSEARRRYRDGESIYIIGLERTIEPLRNLCNGLADDLALNPAYVMVQAWAAGGATNVGMHFDLD